MFPLTSAELAILRHNELSYRIPKPIKILKKKTFSLIKALKLVSFRRNHSVQCLNVDSHTSGV